MAPWLNQDPVVPALLKNVADTLGGVVFAAGLAARFFETPESFFEYARAYQPPDSGFESQYRARIKALEDMGVQSAQAHFWELECRCRALIEEAALGG